MHVLRVRGMTALLFGQAVNAIGNWIAIIAIWGFAAFEFDADAFDLALLFVVLSAPGALFGPLLGVVIDRIGPRRALIVANALGIVSALALTQADSYAQIILLALPLGLIEALASASLDALPPRMVHDDQLVTANALLGGAQDLAIVVGPIIAAIVNVRWGLAGAFLADAVTFGVGLAVALPLKVDDPAPDPDLPQDGKRSAWRELRSGLSLVRRTAGLRWTMSVATITYALWAVFGVLEPLYVREVLAESDTMFAMFQTVFGVGLVLTGLTLAKLGDRVARPRVVAAATVISGLTAALYLGTDSTAVAFVGVFLWGLDVAVFYVPAKTLLQRFAPVQAHGRVLALNQSLEPMAAIIVTPIAALLVGATGVQAVAFGAAGCAVAAGLVAFRSARNIGPVPARGEVDPTAGTSRDAIALGGAAPG